LPPNYSSPGPDSMLRYFSSTPAKSCITLLLWAHTLGATIARRIVVDDAETDKILYSKGWTESHSCPGCPAGSDRTQDYINNGTWHRQVRNKSDNLLALMDLVGQCGEDFRPWKCGLQFHVHWSVLVPSFHRSHHMTPARNLC